MLREKLEQRTQEVLNVSYTENGARGYSTTGHKLVDVNFTLASMRNMSEQDIIGLFMPAFCEDPELGIKWLFFARDIRGGAGERRVFRILSKALADRYPEQFCNVLVHIPEYGRWDDLIYLLNHTSKKIQDFILDIIYNQLGEDMVNMAQNKSCSLLAKWLPSNNTHNLEMRQAGSKIRKRLHKSQKEYRKIYSALRKYLDVTEVKMCAQEWDKIDYSHVPSKANLMYYHAFMKHDTERRQEYLEALQEGKTKINAGALFPYEIVSKYGFDCWYRDETLQYQVELEQLWQALPNLETNRNTLVVADGSGSMCCAMAQTTSAWSVAHALAIYFAERIHGEFHNSYITFGAVPRLVQFNNTMSLYDKLCEAEKHSDMSNTNIELVFQLVLHEVIAGHMSNDDIPDDILIISDMEFDDGCDRNGTVVFESLQKLYNQYGYKMPRLVFWNVASRTNTIPLTQNENGVILVSGFTSTIYNMVATGELDPYQALVKVLQSSRYERITWES